MNSRLKSYRGLLERLVNMGEAELIELLQKSSPLHKGIGGISSELVLDDINIFVKRVPLTALEMQQDNLYSTKNLFDLPLFYQYGVGSAGFGAWRELKAHLMTTDWVVSGQCPNFIMLYHWRILPRSRANAENAAEVDKSVDYWEGSPAIRNRLEALQKSRHDLCLFLEYIPETLYSWMDKKIKQGGIETVAACQMVERNLKQTTTFANKNGLVHFDSHFENILTDGKQTYLCDFGLALSSTFDLTEEEHHFLEQHRYIDQCFILTNLLHRIVTSLYGQEHWIEKLAELIQHQDKSLAPEMAILIEKYGPITKEVDRFYQKLMKGSKLTPYPAQDLESLLENVEQNAK